MKIRKLYPNGKEKSLTFSYDDGNTQDLRLLDIFNRYGVKGTFNMNSHVRPSHVWYYKGTMPVHRLALETVVENYAGHEAAIHTCTHPRLETLNARDLYTEIYQDKKTLEGWFGAPVDGMALPFGSWNDDVLEALRKLGILYCRTVRPTYSFDTPKHLPLLDPTCGHADARLLPLADDFLETEQELALFYVWGHSYNFDGDGNWDLMDTFLQKVAGKENVWYATNREIVTYLNACDRLVIGDDFLLNPSELDVWVRVNGTVTKIPADSWLDLPEEN